MHRHPPIPEYTGAEALEHAVASTTPDIQCLPPAQLHTTTPSVCYHTLRHYYIHAPPLQCPKYAEQHDDTTWGRCHAYTVPYCPTFKYRHPPMIVRVRPQVLEHALIAAFIRAHICQIEAVALQILPKGQVSRGVKRDHLELEEGSNPNLHSLN
jgi:hypothetical protein